MVTPLGSQMSAVKRQPRTALLILDMISEFRFPDGLKVLRGARAPARANAPVIYVNDTAGKWESDARAFVNRCLHPSARGRDVVELIQPQLGEDYFMFKPKHSAFYGTSLESLLAKLGVRRLVLTGTTAHQCVLFTAMDAHVREFELAAPADCLGAMSRTEKQHALFIFENALRAHIGPSSRVRWR
jgi:nicotinamidase-related amidase